MARIRTVQVVLGLLAVAHLVLVGGPAAAACHVAAFAETEVAADEAAGSVTLTVFLQGRQPSCEGTVDFATEDGTATAGQDYEASEGTLEFVQGDDREETIEITLLDDDASEGDEDFSVVLANPSGGISGTAGPATVTVADDDAGSGTSTPAEATTTPAETPATETETGVSMPEVTPTAAETAGATPADAAGTPDDEAPAEDETAAADDTGDGGGTPWVPIVLGVLVVGGIAAALAARRR